MDDTGIKENIFRLIQTYLKNPPLIVWGSGATIPFGIPSMTDLNNLLMDRVPDFDGTKNNLEKELNEEKYHSILPEIKNIIWERVKKDDNKVLEKIIQNDKNIFEGLFQLINRFIDTHPQKLNIVTTNYDCVLEHFLSFHDIQFTDGFIGKQLSLFDEKLFQKENQVNLVKVHGSLNWFDLDGNIRYWQSYSDTFSSQIIIPGINKYREAYKRPYRELIQKSDNYIDSALSFLVVGFGFNDEHLTPKIKNSVKNGKPVVLITKSITDSTFEELKNAEKYIFIEKNEKDKTRILYKNGSQDDEKELIMDGYLWQLKYFMEVI